MSRSAALAIDLVLAIDISSSMDGLIDSAKLKLWDIVKAELKKIVPPEAYPQSEAKINGSFRAGAEAVAAAGFLALGAVFGTSV